MPIKKPATFSAGRKVVIGGTTYQPGDAIPNATVKAIKHLSALLSRRFIIPNLDPYRRRTKLSTPTPTDIQVTVRKTL